MKSEKKYGLTLSVDEATRETMYHINEGISDSLGEALEPTNDLINEMSGKADKILSSSTDNLNVINGIKEAVSVIIENQNRNARSLEEITEKLSYLCLPFYKRMLPRRLNESISNLRNSAFVIFLQKQVDHMKCRVMAMAKKARGGKDTPPDENKEAE